MLHDSAYICTRMTKVSVTAKSTGNFGAVVMNQHRSPLGSRVGTFMGTGDRGFVGTSLSSSSSTSAIYGDLMFLFNGKEALRLQGISDSHGVHRARATVSTQYSIGLWM